MKGEILYACYIQVLWDCDYEGLFWIATGEMRDGTMPKKAQLLVKEFIEQYRDELLEMWNSQKFHELEPLE